MPGNWFTSWRKQLACQQGALRVGFSGDFWRRKKFAGDWLLLRRLHPSSMLVLLVQPLVFHWAMRSHEGNFDEWCILIDAYSVQGRWTWQNKEQKSDKRRGLWECLTRNSLLHVWSLQLQRKPERTSGQERIVYEVKDKEMSATARGYDLIHKAQWITRWWFQIFFIFTPTWGNDPIWLSFFKGVETTN